MPIVGFNIEKIYVEKSKPIVKDMKVKNDMKINDISTDIVNIGGLKDDVLKFVFEFTSDYQPKIGNIQINGNVLFSENKAKIKEIISSWKRDKKIPREVMNLIMNTILMRCNIKALNLSQEVNLPPNIRLPIVTIKSDKKEDYFG